MFINKINSLNDFFINVVSKIKAYISIIISFK